MTLPVISRELGNRTVRIRATGDLDLDTAYLVREAVDTVLVAEKPARIAIDLSDVSLVDSVGIGVLVSCYHAATAYGVSLEAVDPSPAVYRQLWISGLVGLFGLATPRPEADAVTAAP